MAVSPNQRNILVILLFFPIAALLLYGKDLSKSVLFQYGSNDTRKQDKLEKRYRRLFSLKQHGDMGFGFGVKDQNQVLAWAGDYYVLEPDGALMKADYLFPLSFVMLSQFSPDDSIEFQEPLDLSFFELYLLQHFDASRIYALSLQGTFREISLNFLSPESKITNDDKNLASFFSIKGVIYGFLFPKNFSSPFSDRFVFYFISEDGQVGGRVLDFDVEQSLFSYDLKKKHTVAWAGL